ncbi:MAG: purine-nucleoside phosphorylase [Bacillota bacterium]|nr:purine-nucleoside phosphorylase [Bacillota bacterium]
MNDRPVFNYEYYQRSADYIRKQIGDFKPKTGIILGTGLGDVADLIEAECIIPYEDIPNFLTSKAPGHKGRLIVGRFEGRKVICMQGRFHSYDGYHFEELSIPIRVMKILGTQRVIISNAAGAVNTEYRPGDIMVIKDHIKLTGSSPMRGPNVPEFGERFFDTTNVYTPELRKIARQVGEDSELTVHEGVYFFYPGPQFETPAEIRAERILGADVTGMSTVPEALAAAQCKMPCLGLSLVANMAAGVLGQPLSGDEVEETAKMVAPLLLDYFKKLIRKLP